MGRVTMLEMEDHRPGTKWKAVKQAHAMDTVSFTIEGAGVKDDIAPGMVISDVENLIAEAETFLANVMVLSGPGEVSLGFTPVLAGKTARGACRVEEIFSRLDPRTGLQVES